MLAISEIGCTPSKKMPLGVRLKSTRRSEPRGFFKTKFRGPEIKNLDRGCDVIIPDGMGRVGVVGYLAGEGIYCVLKRKRLELQGRNRAQLIERRSRVHVEVWAHGERLHILNRFW